MAAVGILINIARQERVPGDGAAQAGRDRGHGGGRPGRPERGSRAAAGERAAVCGGGRRRHRRSPRSRRWPSPRRWSAPGPRPPDASSSSVRPGPGPGSLLDRRGFPRHAAARAGHRPQAVGRRAWSPTRRPSAGLAVGGRPDARRDGPLADPQVVVSVGGYASVRPRLAAVVSLRVPLVLVNVDAVPGLGQPALRPVRRAPARWLGRHAAAPVGRSPGRRSARRSRGVERSAAAARPGPGRASACPRTGRPSAVFGGSLGAAPAQRRRRPGWPTAGPTAPTCRSTTSSARREDCGESARGDPRRLRLASPPAGCPSRSGWTCCTRRPTSSSAGPGR